MMQVSFEHIHSVLLHDKYTCKTERNVLCKAGSTGKKKGITTALSANPHQVVTTRKEILLTKQLLN